MIKMNVSAETFDGDMVTETLWFLSLIHIWLH